jgi:hypothetical protein
MLHPTPDDDAVTSDELRRVARWLASIGYYSAAGQCHRRAWQREQLAQERRDDGETLDTIPNQPAR